MVGCIVMYPGFDYPAFLIIVSFLTRRLPEVFGWLFYVVRLTDIFVGAHKPLSSVGGCADSENSNTKILYIKTVFAKM